MFDYNDLSLGIVQAAQTMTSYYISATTARTSPTTASSAASRSRLNGGLAADLTYRQGYFADKDVREVHRPPTRSVSSKTR